MHYGLGLGFFLDTDTLRLIVPCPQATPQPKPPTKQTSKTATTSITMQSDITLPQRTYCWTDECQNKRVHCFVQLPSGISNNDFIGQHPKVVKSGSHQFLKFLFAYNPVMIDVDRIFGHPILVLLMDTSAGDCIQKLLSLKNLSTVS